MERLADEKALRRFPNAAGEDGTACRGPVAAARDRWRGDTTASELGQFARKTTHLLTEIAPRARRNSSHESLLEAQHRARLPVQGSSAGHVPEALIARDLLGEQNEAPQRNGAHGPSTAAAAAGSDSGAEMGPSCSLGP